MKKSLIVLVVMLLFFTTSAMAFFIDFENGTEGQRVNNITGVSFENFNGYNPIYSDIRSGLYNATSDDLGTSYNGGSFHMYGNFCIWAGPEADARGVKIDFTNNDGTFFKTGYSSSSIFYLVAYYTDGSSSTVSGDADLNGPMQFLQINAGAGQLIDYVVLHDSGNLWIVDNMSGDATGIPDQKPVPEPATMLLLGSGILGLAGIRRKK